MKVIPFYYDDYDDLLANTYILIDDSSSCVVIDPSKDYPGISNYIKKNKLSLKGILLTHGHFDHIRGVKRLMDEYNCPVFIGFDEVNALTSPIYNCSRLLDGDYVLDIKTETVSDGQTLKLLDKDILCISTPYHTSGSICYYCKDDNLLFTGDFLFKGSIGRSDLPGAKPKEFINSINKIMVLPEITKLFPGHGPTSSIKFEKDYNPYLK